jgi:hypothetical protein
MFKSSCPAGFSRGGGSCGGRYRLTRACTANCVVLVCTPMLFVQLLAHASLSYSLGSQCRPKVPQDQLAAPSPPMPGAPRLLTGAIAILQQAAARAAQLEPVGE